MIAKDAAGNAEAGGAPGAANRRTFTVDAPDLAAHGHDPGQPANPSATGTVTFTWTGSDDVTPAGEPAATTSGSSRCRRIR